MKNLKKVVILTIIAIFLVGIFNIVWASEDGNYIDIPDEGGKNNTINNVINELNNTNTNNTNTNNTNTNNNTNNSISNTTNLPKAGSQDGLTICVISVVLGISAIYAYKKIKDYNIK